MEIKIEEKKVELKKIEFAKLEPGTVVEFYEGKNSDPPGAIAIKGYKSKEYFLLTFPDGTDWFRVGDGGSLPLGIKRVLGKLVGITVEPID